MDAKDRGSYATCASRELSEEAIITPEWGALVEAELLAHPKGHNMVTLVKPSTGAEHTMAIWLVTIPPELSESVRPTPEGETEMQKDSLQWRPAEDVLRELRRFPFLDPSTDVVLDRLAAAYPENEAALQAVIECETDSETT